MKLRLALSSIGLTLLVLAACGGGEEESSASLRLSPPPPDTAPASVVQTVVTIPLLEVDQSLLPTVPPPPCPGDATKVTVLNRDEGGSDEYAFDPNGFTFSVGECVEFTVTAETEFHTFTVDELGINLEINGGETGTFDFTFSQAGTFKLFCTPHESLGMVGTITVQ